jgi:hypothetical protein
LTPFDGIMGGHQHTGDAARMGGDDLRLHFHGFQYQQAIACRHGLPYIDVNFNHHAAHPGNDVSGTGGGNRRGVSRWVGRRR